MRIVIISSFLAFIFLFCSKKQEYGSGSIPEEGIWRGVISIRGQELPFSFSLKRKDPFVHINLINGEEKILIDKAKLKGDSIHIPMHIFDTRINAEVSGNNSMRGYWKKNYIEGYRMPFQAKHDTQYRFSPEPQAPVANISGKWEVYFIAEEDSSLAVGIFKQSGNYLEGTFLTPTGDYRFLEGEIDGNQMKMSTFDGEHAYLFHADIDHEDTVRGEFWSGKSWHQSWTGVRNEEVSLPDPYSLTYLKNGYDRINFQLPGMDGEMVSLDDPKYRGKVVIIQIFGSWCPNCMDETKFLAEWYERNKHRNVEIVALAFERKNDLDYARNRIHNMVEKYDIGYDFVFGGKADKEEVEKVLPMLNSMISFPTTLFIDRSGKVRKIHTGFSGPGTGEHYEQFIRDFNLFTDKLIEEF